MASACLDERLAVAMFVAIGDSADCWEWTGSRDAYGYGRFKANHRTIKAHRAAYRVLTGKSLSDGFHLHHTCENPGCCNPFHLVPIANGDHMRIGDTPPARNVRKTHCLRGHALSGDNLRVGPAPKYERYCVTCKRARSVARYHRLKAAA